MREVVFAAWLFTAAVQGQLLPPSAPQHQAKPKVELTLFTATAEQTAELLRGGADPNRRDPWGLTPLIRAAGENELAKICLLLDAGASVNARTDDGRTALMAAAGGGVWHGGRGKPDVDIVRLLLAKGAWVDTANSSGETSLMLGAGQGQLNIVDVLLAAQADPTIRAGALCKYPASRSGWTALMHAASSGNPDVIRRFLELGVEVGARGFDGWTALTAAAHQGNAEVVQLLVEAGSDVQERVDVTVWPYELNKVTPLMLAARNGADGAVRVLLRAGAEVDASAEAGYTALAFAALNGGHPNVVATLLEAGASPNPELMYSGDLLDVMRRTDGLVGFSHSLVPEDRRQRIAKLLEDALKNGTRR
ncbi:MAG: ankyrin repeat domain-containing protein [Phycisphaerales bacterium]